VTAVVNAAGLLDPQRRTDPDAVLNGIAALEDGEYLLTGKLWPTHELKIGLLAYSVVRVVLRRHR